MNYRTLLMAAALTMLVTSAVAQSTCAINGVIEAEPNLAHPELGGWQYTLVATWDTGSNYALSHMNLLIGAEDRCICDDLENALAWAAPAGESDGEDDCTVPFMMIFECDGDPSLGINEPLFKFEYVEDTGCEPANVGTLTMVFYSNYAPGMIYEPNLFLVDKHAGLSCAGNVSGVFPGLPCDPVANEALDWGTVKAVYGH